MVALDEYFHHKGTKTRSWRFATSISPVFRNRPLVIDHCSLIFERSADAYGKTLIFSAPDSTGNWWGDAAVQSDYGANEIIFCGYRFDAETQLYYVRNRTYNPVLGCWIQRDPIGYSGGINLYSYVESSPIGLTDAGGRSAADGASGRDIYQIWPFIAGGGTFNVYLDSGSQQHWATNVSVSFDVSKSLRDGKHCKCKQIKLVQYVKANYDSTTRGWHLDDGGDGEFYRGQEPFYKQQHPWIGDGRFASAFDYPGPTRWTEGRYDYLSQKWKVYAVCTKGTEAFHSYGYVEYGIDYEFRGQGLIWRWINGVSGHVSGPPGDVPNMDGKSLKPKPGYVKP